MKKILLVATVLAGGIAISQAGLNISIGIGLPFPPPAVIIRPPVLPWPAPVYVAPPYCPPRVVIPCAPARYQPRPKPGYHRHGPSYAGNHRGNGHRH